MDELSFLDVISGRRRGVGAGLLRSVLSLCTPPYRTAVALRNALYDTGVLACHRAGVQVISIGNLTTGGTGKTPVVACVTQQLLGAGHHPAIISRGYRSLDGTGNDEARVLQQLCPGVPQGQNRDRVAAADEMLSSHRPDVLILDDAFQHRRIARDLDIVLIDALDPWGYGRLLPRGLLREPKSALHRADLIVLTRIDQVESSRRNALRDEVQTLCRAPIVEVAFRPQQLIAVSGESAELSTLAGQRVAAFCGIGNPEGFRRTLLDAGINIEGLAFRTFPDHHHYTAAEIGELQDWARSTSAQALITTQKDLVKLDTQTHQRVPIWGLVIAAEVISGREAWDAALQRLFAETPDASLE